MDTSVKDETLGEEYWKLLIALSDAGVKDEDVTDVMDRLEKVVKVTEHGAKRLYEAVNRDTEETHRFIIYNPLMPLRDKTIGWGDIVVFVGKSMVMFSPDDFLEKYAVLPFNDTH